MTIDRIRATAAQDRNVAAITDFISEQPREWALAWFDAIGSGDPDQLRQMSDDDLKLFRLAGLIGLHRIAERLDDLGRDESA